MRKSLRLVSILGAVATAAALTLPAGSAVAAGPGSAYTCTGGPITSGSYASITVTGFCSVAPDAVIDVAGNIDVAPGAVLDAQSAPSTITVGHNVTAGAGSLVGLGCQPPSYVGNSGHTCEVEPTGHSVITVNGNVTGTDAMVVLLNGVAVGRNVTLSGGGSEEIPWSIKNNTIGGNLTVSNITDEWLGVMFNHVGGNVTLTNVTLHDVDPGAPGVYIVQNHVGRNLNCFNLVPGVSGGFNPNAKNVVGHRANGQCAALV
jgi:hypothetical protein